ncbi:MAG: 3-hydroxyacyl-ACP dehydratase FabZ family protein [Myxococcota bacterium]|jgi:3-hydroxyacyl-[acyl-carrier-protein] dehydratase|nr:3-hydroxyacyl-ACP dehydratase FabZ family protein [Myxococcota bacterium]
MRWVFLDRITDLQPGLEATGLKAISGEADYFREHFPDFPVMPGVLLLEALAQLSGKLLEATVLQQRGLWVWPILSMMDKVKFKQFVRPGQTVQLHTKLVELRDESGLCRVRATVDGKQTTSAEQIFVFDPAGLDTEEGRRKLARHEDLAFTIAWEGWPRFVASLPAASRPPGKD